ncbi:glycoside hydrolase family 26 protein [Streptomyces sp. NBC_01187]|uniref:glycoside hydrolase family 26 protein n=1 Tax=Streptomyces sp. NBC_01187 TaxID=2903766 RepID=UPI00386DA274|nr:glycosyl hydrolase [Streptomyces sp. NBC_01187]
MRRQGRWLVVNCVTATSAAILVTAITGSPPDGAGGADDGREPYAAPARSTASPSGDAPGGGAPTDGAPSGGTDTAARTGPSDVPAEYRRAEGAFLSSTPEGVERIADLQLWLGGRRLQVGHTYLPGDVWANIEGKPDFLRPWTKWRRTDSERMFVLNVPMLERNEKNVPDGKVRSLLRTGARGAFDRHFRTLAERLVRLGAPDTVLVLGWEMNGTTYTHRCGPDPRAWKSYWRRIVTTMRAVRGQKFRFDFAPNRGEDAIGWTKCYPGDDVVDIIGMDSYDQPPGEDFTDMVNQPYGLRQQVEFAAAHRKPISYPEWGLFRNGDNPEYMRGMLRWIDRHKPLYQTITDYCPHGVWQCRGNPESSAVFRDWLSAHP